MRYGAMVKRKGRDDGWTSMTDDDQRAEYSKALRDFADAVREWEEHREETANSLKYVVALFVFCAVIAAVGIASY